MSKLQEFKVWPEEFEALLIGVKKAEVRNISDRNVLAKGDFMELRENNKLTYTGRVLWARITHVQHRHVPPPYVVYSIEIVTAGDVRDAERE